MLERYRAVPPLQAILKYSFLASYTKFLLSSSSSGRHNIFIIIRFITAASATARYLVITTAQPRLPQERSTLNPSLSLLQPSNRLKNHLRGASTLSRYKNIQPSVHPPFSNFDVMVIQKLHDDRAVFHACYSQSFVNISFFFL